MAPKSAAAPKPPPVLSDSPAAVQQRANSAGIGEFELPKAGLVKLAKGSVCNITNGKTGWRVTCT